MKISKEEKTRLLEEWKRSGKSAWAFAKEKGYKQQTFAKWVKAEKETQGGFVEIRQSVKSAINPEMLIEKGDIRIHIPLGMSSRELSAVIGSIKATL